VHSGTLLYSLYYCDASLILYARRSLLLLTIMCISYLLTYLTVASMEQMKQLLAPPDCQGPFLQIMQI